MLTFMGAQHQRPCCGQFETWRPWRDRVNASCQVFTCATCEDISRKGGGELACSVGVEHDWHRTKPPPWLSHGTLPTIDLHKFGMSKTYLGVYCRLGAVLRNCPGLEVATCMVAMRRLCVDCHVDYHELPK